MRQFESKISAIVCRTVHDRPFAHACSRTSKSSDFQMCILIIDIRDTVNYKDVMKHYKLGPNGGIVTSLNLFATKFGDVIDLIRQKDHDTLKYVIIDTPGQIEVFNWSVSGTIITDGLASIFPTVVVYVMDTARSTTPSTFMSNMLYACSIMYKTRLPFIVVMNKVITFIRYF